MTNPDRILLTDNAFDIAAEIARVQSGDSGGVNVFLGCTRHDTSPDGKPLIALDYEAYSELAIKQLTELVSAARTRWKLSAVSIIHRTGSVGLGEPSVLIVVATAHRAESFEACRFLIDELKKSAAIWKKEVWADGKTSWTKGFEIKTHNS